VLLGERANGWYSVYVGQDFALTFSDADELRRGFENGVLYRATIGRTLERLIARHSEGVAEHLVERLDPAATESLLSDWRSRVSDASAAITRAHATPLRSVGDKAPVLLHRLHSIASRAFTVAAGMKPTRRQDE
jgi:hypothetical protein